MATKTSWSVKPWNYRSERNAKKLYRILISACGGVVNGDAVTALLQVTITSHSVFYLCFSTLSASTQQARYTHVEGKNIAVGSICANSLGTFSILTWVCLININFCSIAQQCKPLYRYYCPEGWLFIYEKLYKRFTSPSLPFGPTCDETSKYSPVTLRPSHLDIGGQRSSICLPLSLRTTLLAWRKRIRHIN